MILVIAATEIEIAPCRMVEGCRFVVSGMGATNTAITMSQSLTEHRPELVIQIGIAGAIDRSLAIGEVVSVTSDYQADLGAWRDGRFTAFSTPHLSVKNRTPYRAVAARSVNTACVPHINDQTQIESMEGAAFFQAAAAYGVAAIQIRAISNYIDMPRSEWDIAGAIATLPAALLSILAQ